MKPSLLVVYLFALVAHALPAQRSEEFTKSLNPFSSSTWTAYLSHLKSFYAQSLTIHDWITDQNAIERFEETTLLTLSWDGRSYYKLARNSDDLYNVPVLLEMIFPSYNRFQSMLGQFKFTDESFANRNAFDNAFEQDQIQYLNLIRDNLNELGSLTMKQLYSKIRNDPHFDLIKSGTWYANWAVSQLRSIQDKTENSIEVIADIRALYFPSFKTFMGRNKPRK